MGSAQVQGELWGALAEDWATLAEPMTAPLWKGILDSCDVSKGTRLLDMGCGGGGLSVLAAQMGATVCGIDAAPALIEIARRRVPEGEFAPGDLELIPYYDGDFDVVVACNSIQFAADRTKAVSEARRVLKPAGKFAIGMWCEPERNDMSTIFFAVRALDPPPPGATPPPDLTNPDNLKSLVQSGGFRIEREAEVECVFNFANAEECWRSVRSAGILVGVAQAVGEHRLHDTIIEAVAAITKPDGSIRLSNWFRHLICT